MEPKLRFRYDRVGDILYIEKVPPYANEEWDMLAGNVVARSNPETGQIEGLEILSFVKTFRATGCVELPIDASLGVVPAAEDPSPD